MDYFEKYERFINRAKSKTPVGYTEKHHILPKSLGGRDVSENLVVLSFVDHVIAHYFLAKAVGGEMWVPLMYMLRAKNRADIEALPVVRIKAKRLEEIRTGQADHTRDRWKSDDNKKAMSSAIRKSRSTAESKKKTSKASKQLWESDEHKKRMTAKQKERWANAELRIIQSEKVRKTWACDAMRRKASEHAKRLWEDDDRLKAVVEKRKRLWSDPKQKMKVSGSNSGRATPVVAVDAETGKRKRFCTQASALAQGFATSYAGLGKCLAGKSRTHNGYVWRYEAA